jgi:hypothetical protein
MRGFALKLSQRACLLAIYWPIHNLYYGKGDAYLPCRFLAQIDPMTYDGGCFPSINLLPGG